MKRIFICICLTMAAFFLSEKGQAQKLMAGEVDYQASFPMGDFKDFVGKPSWAGFSIQGRRYHKGTRLSLGAGFSWFYFGDKQGRTTTDLNEGGTVTGYTTNYTNIYALNLIAQYDFAEPTEKIVPFVRIGAGGAYQNQKSEIGLYVIKNDGIQFLGNAELGVRLSKNRTNGLVLAATWHQLPKSGDLIASSFFGIKLGITRLKF